RYATVTGVQTCALPISGGIRRTEVYAVRSPFASPDCTRRAMYDICPRCRAKWEVRNTRALTTTPSRSVGCGAASCSALNPCTTRSEERRVGKEWDEGAA